MMSNVTAPADSKTVQPLPVPPAFTSQTDGLQSEPHSLPEETADRADRPEESDAETKGGEPGAEANARDEAVARMVQVRLSDDKMRLEVYLTPTSQRALRNTLAQTLYTHCLPLKLDPQMTIEQAQDCIRQARIGRWVTVLEGKPAVPPINGSISFVMKPEPAVEGQWFHPRVPIYKGDTIVRISPGREGEAGHDLSGKVLPVGSFRPPVIPAGENTVIEDKESGCALVAACDGELVFDRMKIVVRPALLLRSRQLVAEPVVHADGDVFVVDNVPPRTEISASGDIYVCGDVDAANMASRRGSITVNGCVTGYHTRHCVIEAAGDVNIASVLYANIKTKSNIRIQTQARTAKLTASGHLYLLSRLRGSLYEVELHVDGAVIPADSPNSPPDIEPTERNTFLVPCEIDAKVGLYDPHNVVFRPCRITELSVAGARLHIAADEGEQRVRSDKVVLLKFCLPGAVSSLQVLGRTLSSNTRDTMLVAFRQLSFQAEAEIIAYCLAALRARTVLAHRTEESAEDGTGATADEPTAVSGDTSSSEA